MKKGLEKLSTIELVTLLKADYEIFGSDADKYPTEKEAVKRKRKIILEILLERLDK